MKQHFNTNYVLVVVAFCAGMIALLCFAVVAGFKIGYNHYKD